MSTSDCQPPGFQQQDSPYLPQFADILYPAVTILLLTYLTKKKKDENFIVFNSDD